MGKPKGKKGKNKNQQLIEEKKKMLQKYWDTFHSQCEEFETRLNSNCNEICDKIQKLYADRLKKIPENIRNMTLTEYLEMQKQQEVEAQKPDFIQELGAMSGIRFQFEKSKFDSEKKKTLKKQKTERKRSCSVSNCSGKKIVPPPVPRISRVLSESCLQTPLNKQSVAPSFVVTPKFNPRLPISKACKRKPRAGEVVLSMSGSPLHNFIDDIAEKPAVSVSLGGGKVISITEDTELVSLENDFIRKLDEETKSTLANLKQKLDTLLKT